MTVYMSGLNQQNKSRVQTMTVHISGHVQLNIISMKIFLWDISWDTFIGLQVFCQNTVASRMDCIDLAINNE